MPLIDCRGSFWLMYFWWCQLMCRLFLMCRYFILRHRWNDVLFWLIIIFFVWRLPQLMRWCRLWGIFDFRLAISFHRISSPSFLILLSDWLMGRFSFLSIFSFLPLSDLISFSNIDTRYFSFSLRGRPISIGLMLSIFRCQLSSLSPLLRHFDFVFISFFDFVFFSW